MINLSHITSGIEIETAPQSAETGFIPHNIAVLGMAGSDYEGSQDTPIVVADSQEAEAIFGAGSQLARLVKPLDGVAATITCFALAEPDSAKAKTIELTVSKQPESDGSLAINIAEATITVEFNNGITLENLYTAIALAINENTNLPFSAAAAADKVTLTSKWKEISANDILVSATISTAETISLSPTAATGTMNFNKSFEAMGSIWYTLCVIPSTTEAVLQQASTLALARGGTDSNMPMLCVAGNVQGYANFNTLVQKFDSMAMMIVNVPGSMSVPGEIAADEIYKRIMCSQQQPNLSGRTVALRYTLPGNQELTPSQKEAVVKNGGATVTYLSGAVYVDNDATTSKTVNGKDNDVWRWAGTVMNYFAKIYSLKTMFTTAPFDDYIIVDDAAKTSSQKAVKPGTVKQYLCSLMDSWADSALSKNVDTMKSSIKVSVPKGNVQSYLIEFEDDMAVAGKRIFIRYAPKISSNV